MIDRIATDRLVLRAWRIADAPLLKAALDANYAHLSPWIPQAVYEPAPLASIVERIERYEAWFSSDKEWLYAIFTAGERALVGGCGLYPRVGPGAVEVGYWVQEAHTRRGYATEAARAVTKEAFAKRSIDRVEIRCDPRNVASALVPERLGFRHIATLRSPPTAGIPDSEETMVWQLVRAEFEARNAAPQARGPNR